MTFTGPAQLDKFPHPIVDLTWHETNVMTTMMGHHGVFNDIHKSQLDKFPHSIVDLMCHKTALNMNDKGEKRK